MSLTYCMSASPTRTAGACCGAGEQVPAHPLSEMDLLHTTDNTRPRDNDHAQQPA